MKIPGIDDAMFASWRAKGRFLVDRRRADPDLHIDADGVIHHQPKGGRFRAMDRRTFELFAGMSLEEAMRDGWIVEWVWGVG